MPGDRGRRCGPATRPGNPGYTSLPVPGICGHRFQVPAARAAELCRCGRQSIGQCVSCGVPLCGLHGTDRGYLLCATCVNSLQAAQAHIQQEARRAADQDRADLLASGDPAAIARGAAAISSYNRTEAADAWQAYLAAASPSPQYERVRIAHGFRWKLPTEVSREPLWYYSRVAANKNEYYCVDRAGNGYLGFGKQDGKSSVSGSCVIPAGAALTFARYGRGTDRYGLQKIAVATYGAMMVSDKGHPAPAVLLIALICQLAGQPKESHDTGWSVVPGELLR